MSILLCSLSNAPTDDPVISPISGRIFDRSLILKHVNEYGEDPIAKLPLTPDMLISVKVDITTSPKLPTYTSIPALLQTLQKEWDAITLHSFSLRQQLQAARQELSHSLYQHDAACRVIARLSKEVSAAREALATLKPQAAQTVATHRPGIPSQASDMPDEGDLEVNELSSEILYKLDMTASSLTQQRKQRGRKLPDNLTPSDVVKGFVCQHSHVGIHSASTPGILCLDICPFDEGRRLVTGGNDKVANVFDLEHERTIASFRGHTKKVIRVIYHPREDVVLTASADATVKVWQVEGSKLVSSLRPHQGSVSGLSLHPTGDYILTSSTAQDWAFSDVRSSAVICRVCSADPTQEKQTFTCAQFHPDGLIFGLGTSDSMIRVWDLKERTNVANFPGHTGPVSAIAFSENGYYLASAAEDAVVKIWDLRKLKSLKSIALADNYEINDMSFDHSGAYLGVAGTDLRVYQVKQWEMLCCHSDHTAAATGIRFGSLARLFVSTSLDRSLKVYTS